MLLTTGLKFQIFPMLEANKTVKKPLILPENKENLQIQVVTEQKEEFQWENLNQSKIIEEKPMKSLIKTAKIKGIQDKIKILELVVKSERSRYQKKDLNRFRSQLRYHTISKRKFSTYVEKKRTNKQELEDAKNTLVRLLVEFAIDRPEKELSM